MGTVGDRLEKAQASGDLDAIRAALLDAKAAGADSAMIDGALAEVHRQKMAAREEGAKVAAEAVPSVDVAGAASAVQAITSADRRDFADAHKKSGNNWLTAKSKTAAREAVQCFTKGLEVCCSDNVLNAQLYSNRAHVRILLREFVDAVDDCRKAIVKDPHNMKAYWRAAKASLHLELYMNALEFCEAGLQTEPGDADIMKMKTLCAERLAVQQRRTMELTTTVSTPEFNADEAMALQERVNSLTEQVEPLERSMARRKREHVNKALARKALCELTEGTRTYISVGRCFLKKERFSVESMLASEVKKLEMLVPKLSKALEELEERRRKAQKELKEMKGRDDCF